MEIITEDFALLNCNKFEDTDDYNRLSITQKKAFDLFKEKENICILGSSGMGKSLLVRTIKEYITKFEPNKKIAITSTTGVSAFSINGLTIHSYLGIGTGEKDIKDIIFNVRKYGNPERLKALDIIVIDEISMLSAELFEKIDKVLQNIRQNRNFFGGIQVVMTGDVLQLPPIFNRVTSISNPKEQDTRLIVESQVFNDNFLSQNIVVLKENFRQKGDTFFFDILNNVRYAKHTKADILALKKRMIKVPENLKPIELVSTNKKASFINDLNIDSIKSPGVTYKTIYKVNGDSKETCDTLKKEIVSQFKAKNIDELILKVGARVMLIKNLDTEIGLVNGAIGTIKEIRKSGEVSVDFDNGENCLIEKILWNTELDDCMVTAYQIPLMLAYALTIHRVQSQTLETAILDIGDAFADHQVYVALSRLRSLNGLYLKTFNPKKIKVNPIMKNFLDNLE